MDDFRTQYLEALDATARAQETLIDRAHGVLRNPEQYGWETTARAAAALPLAGIGAALTDLQRLLVAGSLEAPRAEGAPAS